MIMSWVDITCSVCGEFITLNVSDSDREFLMQDKEFPHQRIVRCCFKCLMKEAV